MDAQFPADLRRRLAELAERRCRPGMGFDAADLVQESLVRLLLWLASTGDVRPEEIVAQAEAYLRYLAVDARHKAQRARCMGSIDEIGLADRLTDEGKWPSWFARQKEAKALLDEAIRHLPPGQRDVAQLIYDGFTQAEIAERRGVTPASVSRLKERAFRRLRKSLPPPVGGE